MSLRATKGSAAIFIFSPCEIASVVQLPRNDIVFWKTECFEHLRFELCLAFGFWNLKFIIVLFVV